MKKVSVITATAIILLLIVVSLGLFYSLSFQATPTSIPKEITVTDALGRNVTLPYPVETVVVGDDMVAELVQLLGAADKVVGIEPSIRVRGYFPKMVNKPITGSQFRGLNYELIAKIRPDVVILMDVGPIAKVIDKLNKIGVKSIVISIRPEKIPYTIKLLGRIFGENERAQKLLEWWYSKWNFLKTRISKVKLKTKVKVFIGMGFSPTNKLPTHTWGKLAYWNYMLDILGMENIASAKLKTHGELSLEYIVKENPDIIIVGDWSDIWLGYMKNSSDLAEKMVNIIMEDPVLQSVNAVKNGKVFIMHYALLLSFRSVIGAYYLAKVIYPELFNDVNPEEIHKEYFEKWLKVPYRGIWFYPKTWSIKG